MTKPSGLLLVVDDEEMNRDLLSRRLEMEGYEVVTAPGGEEALKLVEEHDFDAVLLDSMMPNMNGIAVLTEIRKTRSCIELPVLMVTARTQCEDVVDAFEVGANDYINKPINFPVAIARVGSHVSARKMSSKLRESEMRYSLSAQGANDGLWDWDFSKNTVYYSERWKSMLGYRDEEVSESPNEWLSRVHPEDLPHVQKALEDHRTGKTDKFENEHRMLHRDQSYRWVMTRGLAVRDERGRELRMAGSQTDITRGKAADPLTGLPNRVLFTDHLKSTIQKAAEHHGDCYAVLFIDLDRFKVINDSLGHLVGDELLVAVARRLESCMRTTDVVSRLNDRCTISRFGGDEFVVLLRGLKDPLCAGLVADRILATLSEPFLAMGQEMHISGSIGIAIGVNGQEPAGDLMRDADTAMYTAKSRGKSQWCLFDRVLREKAVQRLELENDIIKAFERGEFEVHYQPIVAVRSRKIQGFESLLRWNHPTRGRVSPLDFIPIAEEIGFITTLGGWVLIEACRQLKEWRETYPGHDDLYVSVNVSSRQLADIKMVEHVRDCLRDTGLSGKSLRLEITESAIINDPRATAFIVSQLRELGCRISLDDFGTGYSSLSYLQDFQIDVLKIDRSFISRLGTEDDSREIVRTIINLAHNLGMEVTAEGIEEHDQHQHLHELTCESAQGYLYSIPMNAVEAADLLLAQSESILLQECEDLLRTNLDPKPKTEPVLVERS